MVTKKTKIIFAAAVAFIVIVAAATSFYLTLQSVSEPFSFSLSVSQDNGAVVQGGNTTITVETAYLNGTSHPIMLSASGGPNGTTFTFTPQTVEPPKTKAPSSSNLTVNVPTGSVTGTYKLNITAATADGTSNSTTYTLIVLDTNEVYVTGTVTANRWTGVYPTKIEFLNANTGEFYWTPLNITAGSQTGNYSLIVPNHQCYQIICWCNFTRASGHSARGFEPMWFTVDCPAGMPTLTKDFTDKDAALVR
jgi:hypothetical protein